MTVRVRPTTSARRVVPGGAPGGGDRGRHRALVSAAMDGGEGTRRRVLDDLRRDLPAVLIAFLVSRLLLLSVVAVLESSIPVAYDRPEYTDRPILGGLTGEDAIYYLGIAEGGYHLEPVKDQYVDWVFFPLYPLVTKLVAIPLMGDIPLAGVLAANLAFLAALLLLAVLSRDHLDGDRTRRSVLLLALAPGAVAFGMAYSDSLMLALWLGAVLAGERRRWWLAGVLYGLSVLTRPPGILLGLALLALLVQQGGRRPNRDWLALAFGPLAILGFMAYQGAVLGILGLHPRTGTLEHPTDRGADRHADTWCRRAERRLGRCVRWSSCSTRSCSAISCSCRCSDGTGCRCTSPSWRSGGLRKRLPLGTDPIRRALPRRRVAVRVATCESQGQLHRRPRGRDLGRPVRAVRLPARHPGSGAVGCAGTPHRHREPGGQLARPNRRYWAFGYSPGNHTCGISRGINDQRRGSRRSRRHVRLRELPACA